MNITRTLENGHSRTLIIDDCFRDIQVKTSSGINPAMRMTTNSDDVIRINKTTISYYNRDMLIYILQNDINAFTAVYNRIYGVITPDNVFKYHVTISQFYNSFMNDLNAWIDFFKSVSHKTRQTIIADHITYDHDAKMHGIISVSTYVGYNKFCKCRMENCSNAICKYCYANSLTNCRQGLKARLIRLHMIFTNIVLCADDIPVINYEKYPYFRFESFGDLNNTIQVNNYNLFAAVNADINFTLWTKNPGIIQNAINNGMVLSNNLIIGLSSLYLNTPELDKAKRYSFIRFLFTVYDDEYIKKHNVNINCGAKHCVSCGICYKYLHEFKTGLYIINERKK